MAGIIMSGFVHYYEQSVGEFTLPGLSFKAIQASSYDFTILPSWIYDGNLIIFLMDSQEYQLQWTTYWLRDTKASGPKTGTQ